MQNEIDKISESYELLPWVRAVVQAIPSVGGSLDVILSSRATKINHERFEKMVSDVDHCLTQLGSTAYITQFLATDEYFEIFRRCTEIVVRNSNENKRKIVAGFLARTISANLIDDLSGQILEDLNVLQPIHLQALQFLPIKAGIRISKSVPPESLSTMSAAVFEKSMSDLERMGFIRFSNSGIGTYGGGTGGWETTEYVRIFREHIGLNLKPD